MITGSRSAAGSGVEDGGQLVSGRCGEAVSECVTAGTSASRTENAGTLANASAGVPTAVGENRRTWPGKERAVIRGDCLQAAFLAALRRFEPLPYAGSARQASRGRSAVPGQIVKRAMAAGFISPTPPCARR